MFEMLTRSCVWLSMLLAFSTFALAGSAGIRLGAQDISTTAGNDFYLYANGRWLASEKIPADRIRWSSSDQLAVEAEQHVRGILDALAQRSSPGSVEQKVGDYFRAFLDTDAIERVGLERAKTDLQAIMRVRTYEDVAGLMGRPDLGRASPVGIGIDVDEKNPDRYVAGIVQSGLGLPDRDYYLKPDAALVEIRQKYRAHIGRMLQLGGELPDNAANDAQAILDLETKIAEKHWPAAKQRESDLTYNLRTRRELDVMAPEFPWTQYLAAAGLKDRREFNVAEVDAVRALAKLFKDTPIGTWQSYLEYHYLVSTASVLPQAFDAEAFDFYGRTLNGLPQQRERWKRGVQAVNGALGDAVGRLYVARYFSPESKVRMAELVENLRKAYAERIEQLPWMTEATKRAALKKLQTLRPKIAYPDQWRDYSALDVRAGDAFGNQKRAAVFDWQRKVQRIDQPTNRDEWTALTPQTVNAYYNPTFNEIVFPAAILQPPFFDPKADPAVNYGGIGAVIGHEMGHGFDDQGAKSDETGILRDWWQPEDEAAFKQRVSGLARQYDQYEPLPGLHLNGQLTLGENIGDLGGITVALKAYGLSLHGHPAPVCDGLTGDQRFFLAYAHIWRALMRDAALRKQVMSNPHSPSEYRVNGVVRNVDAWYTAFDVKPGDKLYLPPEERVRIW